MYNAKVVDFVLTPLSEIKQQIDNHPEDTFLIAHGAIVKNGTFMKGDYHWGLLDTAEEGFTPDGPNTRRFVSLSELGPKLRSSNVFGCYVSPRIRKNNGVSSVDDYTMMYKGLLAQLKLTYGAHGKSNCVRVVRIFEGENSGSGVSTDSMINKYPIQTEDFYNRWLEEYRKRIGGGE